MSEHHHCTDRECPNVGQRTSPGCRCHQTVEQVLRRQRNESHAALKLLVELISTDARYDESEALMNARAIVAQIQ